MNEALAKEIRHTREEYLNFEDQADYKSDYYDGQIIAMAGGSLNHSVICFNMIRRIGEGIDDKDCVGFDSNMKLDIPRFNLFVYPDAMVVCGDIEFSENRTDIIINPSMVIEVLSPGTQSFDRGRKFEYYRSVPSMREYVLISQDEPMVEVYYRQDEKTWLYTVVKGLGETAIFQTIHHEIALKDIYQKVILEQEDEEQG